MTDRDADRDRQVAVASLAVIFDAYMGLSPDAEILGFDKQVRAEAEALLSERDRLQQQVAELLRIAGDIVRETEPRVSDYDDALLCCGGVQDEFGPTDKHTAYCPYQQALEDLERIKKEVQG